MEMEESTRVVALADVERIREQERAMAAASSAPAAPVSNNPWEDEPTRAAPARPASSPWFVMVKSKQEGPLDEDGLSVLMESGTINARSFFWQQGMADWKRGSEIPELAGLFAAPPPPALPPEPATVAVRGGQRGTAAPARAQPAPQQEDHSWDDVPTTVGQAPAAQEAWDLEPPMAAQPQQRQSQRQPQRQQQQQPVWDEPAQQEQPQWDDSAAQAAEQEQPSWDQPAQQDHQPAWDEPAQDDQPAWDEPEQRPAARTSSSPGTASSQAGMSDDLFSDLDLPDRNDPMDEPEPPTTLNTDNADPLASVRGNKASRDEKKPVEDTRYFMKKSGVTRRNPAWKVALFITLPILLVVGGVFALDSLNVVPKVKVVNAQGQTVEKSLFFSGEGRNELQDLLLGRKKTPPPAPTPAPAPQDKKPQPGGTAPKPGDPPAVPETGKSAEELKQLYADSSKTEVSPEVRKDTEVAAKDAEGQAGPPPADILKVVEMSQSAFEGCVEVELRKNPSFKGGRVMLVATVGTSGVVKSTRLDRKELDSAPVGDCIKKSAKRMVFPAFKLDDGSNEVDLEIPLVLTLGAR